jgi:hypothetical protein
LLNAQLRFGELLRAMGEISGLFEPSKILVYTDVTNPKQLINGASLAPVAAEQSRSLRCYANLINIKQRETIMKIMAGIILFITSFIVHADCIGSSLNTGIAKIIEPVL